MSRAKHSGLAGWSCMSHHLSKNTIQQRISAACVQKELAGGKQAPSLILSSSVDPGNPCPCACNRKRTRTFGRVGYDTSPGFKDRLLAQSSQFWVNREISLRIPREHSTTCQAPTPVVDVLRQLDANSSLSGSDMPSVWLKRLGRGPLSNIPAHTLCNIVVDDSKFVAFTIARRRRQDREKGQAVSHACRTSVSTW
jgi:hypothetical protein